MLKPHEGTAFWIEWVRAELLNARTIQLTARGWSMFPTLWRGAQLKIESTPFDHLAIGNLIAFERAGKAVMHRVVKIEQNESGRRVQTQGDSNLKPDEWIDENLFLGKVIAINDNEAHKAIRAQKSIAHQRNFILKQLLLFAVSPYRLARRFLKSF